MRIKPIVLDVSGVILANDVSVSGGLVIQHDSKKENVPNAVNPRTVWVFCLVVFGVVVTMNPCPLFGNHARGQPTPKTEEKGKARVKAKSTVGHGTVVVDGHCHNGDLSHHHYVDELVHQRKAKWSTEENLPIIHFGLQKVN